MDKKEKSCHECEDLMIEKDSGSSPHFRCEKTFKDVILNDNEELEVTEQCPMKTTS